MTLEDGETDEFLMFKLKMSLNTFARKYTKQPRTGDLKFIFTKCLFNAQSFWKN